MSEWLALYIKLSESSLNLDLDLGLKIKLRISHILIGWFLWQISRSYYYYYSQDRAGMPGMREAVI